MNSNTHTNLRPCLRGNKIQFSISVDVTMFEKIESYRGYMPRANFIGEIVRKTFSGEKQVVETL